MYNSHYTITDPIHEQDGYGEGYGEGIGSCNYYGSGYGYSNLEFYPQGYADGYCSYSGHS